MLKVTTKYFLLVISIYFISACAMKNYGYTEQEWASMTEEEKENVQEEFTQAVDAKNDIAYGRNNVEESSFKFLKEGVKKSKK